ncbi:MAG: prepilin-type N-terminal cleavage/methylation domain-containing protein [Verrucomicrobia bacterium]|nr:prepilin-type N-terminal cleavage/methylation domain-containing protein [Verrucomicrobiota bacterium]
MRLLRQGPPARRSHLRGQEAFTLIEVMIAIAIFFIAVFSILELTSRCLRQARALQQENVDIGSLASELVLTNRLEEGMESGNFGDMHRDYTWSRTTRMIATNGLFQVDLSVFWVQEKKPVETRMSFWLYRPESTPRGLGVGRR